MVDVKLPEEMELVRDVCTADTKDAGSELYSG